VLVFSTWYDESCESLTFFVGLGRIAIITNVTILVVVAFPNSNTITEHHPPGLLLTTGWNIDSWPQDWARRVGIAVARDEQELTRGHYLDEPHIIASFNRAVQGLKTIPGLGSFPGRFLFVVRGAAEGHSSVIHDRPLALPAVACQFLASTCSS